MRHTETDGPCVPTVEQLTDRTDLVLRANTGGRDAFGFHTADGVVSPNAFREPELALLESLTADPPEDLLVVDANYGVVGTVMAVFAGTVRMTEPSARAATLCRRNARRNRIDDRTTVAIAADPGAFPGGVDAVAIAPKPYEPCAVIEQRIADALRSVAPGGTVHLAAAPEAGRRRYRRTLEGLCGSVEERDVGTVGSVLRAEPPEDPDPPRFAAPRTLEATVDGTALSLVTYPGVFSSGSLDAGTRALAERLEIDDGERVLDLACGYGPLGLYAARTPDCRVTMTDDDRVATACARRSVVETGVEDVDVLTADGVAGVRDRRFDRVVCNPPTHAGSGVLAELMAGAADVLVPDGRLDLVHHRGVRFDRYLEPVFERITDVERGEYRLVTARP